MNPLLDRAHWDVVWTLAKFRTDADLIAHRPHEILTFRGNLLLNTGINALEQLIAGTAAPTPWNNANARIGVGNSTTAAAATQTGLLGTSTAFATMDTGFPTQATQVITFQATFGSGSANFAWEEVIVDNGATSAIALNRKVQSLGTKSTGSWQIQCAITIS